MNKFMENANNGEMNSTVINFRQQPITIMPVGAFNRGMLRNEIKPIDTVPVFDSRPSGDVGYAVLLL